MVMNNLHLHYSTQKTILALRIIISSIFFLFSSLITIHGNSIKSYIFIYAGCSQEKYQPNSPFEANLNSFLSSVVSSSSQVSYNNFAVGNGSTTPEGSIYGLYQCRGDLKIFDCSKCIGSAVNQITLVCPYSYGASLQLEGCLVRYEHVDFLGKLDTSLRVSSSGLVEGFAQCLGDLIQNDCSSCIADAVGKLKSLCGSAAAVDVFLGQCYARYWASGYYEVSDSSNEDNAGKTVAIIVGAVAGLAVLIVLLSVCRKTMVNHVYRLIKGMERSLGLSFEDMEDT
ncbi:plasmodesmata-located protein 8-like isoform X3 [Malus sylvestris]|uniref:plasmodesmata-located protein 8-like isoform X3 n=1 Tax=Malus sylvestris TaxID=3752 RepID=UPI0021ABE007|nr:plasmodesmata-located protein 8-like isoform X3 [Malus sylvestris]